jgi:hypothetical protein
MYPHPVHRECAHRHETQAADRMARKIRIRFQEFRHGRIVLRLLGRGDEAVTGRQAPGHGGWIKEQIPTDFRGNLGDLGNTELSGRQGPIGLPGGPNRCAQRHDEEKVSQTRHPSHENVY